MMAVWIQNIKWTIGPWNGGWHTDWDETNYQPYSLAWECGKTTFAEMWDYHRPAGLWQVYGFKPW